jgi:hypothetical protein
MNRAARTLNELEASALQMAIQDRPLLDHKNAPIVLLLGEESGQPFVAIGRGDNVVKIHFEEAVE